MTSRVRAYVELARLSNLPTCVSNVLVGVAIGAGAGESLPWFDAALLSLAIALFYAAGMMLNDAVDLPFDRVERPARPIPSGRVTPRSAFVLAAAALLGGLLVLAPFGRPALLLGAGLVAAIVAYDLLHKRFAAAALLMGVCRGLVYLVAAAAVGWPIDWTLAAWLAVPLALYTIAITVVARRETSGSVGSRRWLALAMPLLVLAPIAGLRAQTWWVVIAAVVLLGWLVRPVQLLFARPPRTVPAILSWLAAICLADAFFLTLLGRPLVAVAAAGCFVLTAWGHRHVLGT